jgi:hypothetical protein
MWNGSESDRNVALGLACAAATVRIQAPARIALDKGETVEAAKQIMREYDLRTGRSIRPISKGDAFGIVVALVAELGLDANQTMDLMKWGTVNPGVDEAAIRRAAEMFKAGAVFEAKSE